MLLSVNTKELREGLKAIKPAVPSRATIPVLTGVMMDAKDDRLMLSGTDLEVALSVDIEAEVDEPGSFLVPHSNLVKCIEKAKTEIVEMATTTDHLEISSGVSYRLLKLVDPEEYPLIPDIKTPLVVPGLTNYMKRCLPFQSTDEKRHFLNGVYLASNGKFEVVATTGKILKGFELDIETNEKFEAIVPTNAVKILNSQFPDDIELGVMRENGKATQIAFRAANIVLISRLIEGEYPEWKYVAEERSINREFTVDREELLNTMDQIAVVLKPKRENGGYSGICFNVHKSNLELTATNPEKGEATGLIDAEANGSFSFAANVLLLTDCLNSLETESVTLKSDESGLSPLHLYGEANEHTVIMPMRL